MKTCIPPILAAGAVLLLGITAERAVAGPYSIDIVISPYHPGVVDSWFFDINNLGQSTGYMASGPKGGPYTQSAVIYRSGGAHFPGGGAQSLASERWTNGPSTSGLAINNRGDVVGRINYEPYFFSAGGTATPIQIPGFFVFSPGGLNDSGYALVSVYPEDPANTPPGAFSGLAIWSLGGSQALSILDPLYPYLNPPDPYDFNSGPSSFTYTRNSTQLNGANQFAAGINEFIFDPMDPADPDDDIYTEYFTQAYIYDGLGGYQVLQPSPLGGEIRPIDIDEAGTVFGWAGSQLALWGPNGVLELILPDAGPTLYNGGPFSSYPTVQRNNLGQIVARTSTGGVLFYDPVSGAWTDITSKIDGLGTGTFATIQGFNDEGQFVGLVRPPAGGGSFGYVVSPKKARRLRQHFSSPSSE